MTISLAPKTSEDFASSLPPWAADLVGAAKAKQANTFVLHGVIADLVPLRSSSGLRFLSLDAFLAEELFRAFPSIVSYNRAEGLSFATPEARAHFIEKMKAFDSVHGTSYAEVLPRDAANCFALLNAYFKVCASAQPARPVVVLLPFAETLIPMSDASSRAPEDRSVQVFLRKWSHDPALLAKNVVIVLVSEGLAELDSKIIRSAASREIEIPRPDKTARAEYIEAVRTKEWFERMSDAAPRQLAELTAGLTRVQIGQILDGADSTAAKLTIDRLRSIKKDVIETEGLGLLEYVEPKYDLSMVAGMTAVKDRLRRAARAISRGNPAAVPMGYLVCGPVGSAKTFLVECFSKEIGFPCVKLKNFRSMWVGSTEANLERILKILGSLTPVGVIIDEADAALGNREAGGDSGTQNRVFAQIASFMGDTRNRGKILWFLITCRPDLLPIDLKRQGRAEEHIPLFYPETVAEYSEIYRVMLKKLGIRTDVEDVASVADETVLMGFSGSDLEAVLVRATLEAEAESSEIVRAVHLKRAFDDFIPPSNSREREMQTLCAVLESTSRELLPAKYKGFDSGTIQARVNEIKASLRMG